VTVPPEMEKYQGKVRAVLLRVAAEKEKIIEAFLAETGLMPSECELVQVTEDHEIRWFIRRREP